MQQHLPLSEVERQTLTELTIHPPFADGRRRALWLLLLDLGFTPKSAAARLGTTFQSVYNGVHAWRGEGLCGLLGGHQGGRPPKLNAMQTDTLVQRATEPACYRRELDQALHERHPEAPSVNPQTLARALKAHGLRVRRTRLHYGLVRGAARSADLIDFLDRLATAASGRLTCGVLDNASIHTRAAVAARAGAWLMQGLWLYGLPAYSPEINPIEILRKHAKHVWRRFVAWQSASLQDEVDRLLQGYGSKFQTSF